MQISKISNYGIYPAFYGHKKTDNTVQKETTRQNYAMPDFKTSKAYAGLKSVDKNMSSTIIDNVKLILAKSDDNIGSYMISFKNKNFSTEDKVAFEIYKSHKSNQIKNLNEKLEKDYEGGALLGISADTVTMFFSSNPQGMNKYIDTINHIALDIYTVLEEENFDSVKNSVKEYYKVNWNKMKNSKKDKLFMHSELKNEKSIEDVEKKIDSLTYKDYLKFVNEFKIKNEASFIIAIPNCMYNNKSERDILEKKILKNIIIKNKLDRVEIN